MMPPKNPPAARRLKLREILEKSKNGMTLAEIADRLGVSEKTIRRDLTTLVDGGFSIQELAKEAHGRKRWYSEKTVVPLTFNYEEAAAFSLGSRFLAPLKNSSLAEAAKERLQNIRKQLEQLGSQQILILNQLLEIFRESTTGWSDYSQQSKIIEALIMACEEKKETVIRYRSYAAEEEQSHTIHPYALVMQMGTLYVIGFSCKNNEMRTWKLNRITEAECLKIKFKKPKNFDIDAHRRKGFGVFVFSDKPVEKVRIRIDGVMARYVQEHRWHETQHFEEQPDGNVIVQFEVVPTRELTNWILQLGCNAEVLEPESFRQKVASEIVKMHSRYIAPKCTKKQPK